jgi:hypothetical protein
VTMAAIANGIGRVTRRETVETESVIGTGHEGVRGGMTGNGAVEGTERKIKLVMTSGRNESLRLTSEVRRYAVYRFLTRVLLTVVRRGQDTMKKHPLLPKIEAVVRKHQRKEKYDLV